MEIARNCPCCYSEKLDTSPAVLMPFVAERVFGWKSFEIPDSLKTIKKATAYSICNSMICLNCYHLFLDMRFNEKEMDNLYKDYRDEEYTELRDSYEPGYKYKNESLGKGYNYTSKVESFISKHLSENPYILDYGGGSGINTPFKSLSKKIELFDISNKYLAPKRSRYDLIVCANVLEHVPFPIETLKKIALFMDDKSILYIELPYEILIKNNVYLEGTHRQKKYWHEHINFFNEKSIGELLDVINFKVIDFKILPISNESTEDVFQILVRL